ncbi:MAG: hypothetical protein U1F51_00210 [Burkholderiales bacterium]
MTMRTDPRAALRSAVAALLVSGMIGATAQAAPCEAPEHRQFDFWLGEWNVHTPDGKLAGVNRIEREYDGCVLHERYDTGRGYRGESLNGYDAGRKLWHQTWMDNQGTVLLLEGRSRNGGMALEGKTVEAGGRSTAHRITWTVLPDGAVRQHWESDEGGGEWKTVFDGRYTRR